MWKYIVGILVVLLLVPLALPSQFKIERSIEIQAKASDAYAYLVNFDLWREWSPWVMMEPEAEFVFQGLPGVVGSSLSWQGKKIGKGKQTLTEVHEPLLIETRLEFEEPHQAINTSEFRIKDLQNRAEITWSMEGQLSYPFERIFGLFIESNVAPQFEQGLSNIKEQLEKTQN